MKPKPYSLVAAGNKHYLFLNSGKVYSNGSNKEGQLGITQRRTSKQCAPISLENQIALNVFAVEDVSFIQTNQQVFAFGCNFMNKLGVDANKSTINTPTPIPALKGIIITDVAAGPYTTFFLTNEGKVLSIGGSIESTIKWIDINATCIASGERHFLALTVQGDIFVYGKLDQNQLGLHNKTGFINETLQLPGISEPIVDIAAGRLFSAFVTKSGAAYIGGYVDALQRAIPLTKIHFPCTVVIDSIQAHENLLVAKSSCGQLFRWCSTHQEYTSQQLIPQMTYVEEVKGKVLTFNLMQERILAFNHDHQLQLINTKASLPVLSVDINVLTQVYLEQYLTNKRESDKKMKKALTGIIATTLSDVDILFFASTSPAQQDTSLASTLRGNIFFLPSM